MYDYLIVGAGLFGSVFAEQLKHKKVLVIDGRNHIGGNVYTEEICGIHVHKYGPHIFHTNNEEIWNYINQFAKFNNYIHRPKVSYKGKTYSFPINMMTLHQLWGVKTPKEAQEKLNSKKVNIKNPKNARDWLLSTLGEEIYEKFFYGYTIKQWGKEPEELPSKIVKRVPIRFDYNDNYFFDRFQGIPEGGYTQIFHKLLDKAEVKLNTPFSEIKNWRNLAKKLVFTGKPEDLLSNKFGDLEYRSLKFKHTITDGDFQGTAIVNYTDKKVPYTRIVEHKHFEFEPKSKTVITREYPKKYKKGMIPYYPVNTKENNDKYKLYKDEICKHDDIILAGRLGRYQYMDMHQVVANALSEAEKEL